MPPIRAEHGLSWRKGNSSHAVGPVASVGGGVDGDERAKQPRRSVGGVTRRHSPSHSRTPSPNNQQIPSASGMPVHVAAHGHVFAHGTRRSPSSKTAGGAGGSARVGGGGAAFVADGGLGGSSSREKRRGSPDSARKVYAHAHTSQRTLGGKNPAFGPPPKSSARGSAGGSSWGVSSPTSGVGGAGGVGSSTISSPTQPTAGSGRGHSSPTTLGRDARGDKNDGQALATPLLHAGHSTLSSQQGAFLPMPSAAASAANGSGFGVRRAHEAEAREMTPLDRVFLEQPHEGRKDVEDDDLHLCNEIQRHLQSRVQSQLMEATNRNASVGSGGGGGAGGGAIGGGRGSGGGSVTSARSRAINHLGAGVHQSTNQGLSSSPAFVGQEMELINDDRDCYMPDSVLSDPVTDPSAFITAAPHARRCVSAQQSSGTVPAGYASPGSMTIGAATDLLDDPDNVGSAGVPPLSPSSNGGPAQGLVLDVGSSVDYLLDSADSAPRGSSREARIGSPDVQMSEASGDGQLREVVNGFDAMDLDDVENALALLTARKQRIIAKQHAGAAAAAAVHAEAQTVAILVPPQPPPPLSSNGAGAANGGTTSSGSRGAGGSSGRQRRSSGRSRHGGGGEGQSPSAGGRSEAFGGSGGGVRGAPVSFSRAPRGQGRPPPVPGHLSASTAAMRRSSPGNIASLAELDSYLEHHHRRLVEQVEGGVLTDDVEAEIKASRHPRRGTRSHQRFGAADGSSNGLGSSSSSSGVPRTVGARVSTAPFFHSTLSADGDPAHYHHRDWNGRGRDGGRQGLDGGHPLNNNNGDDDGEWDPPQKRGPYKRERGEPCEDSGDGGWGVHLRGFRGEGSGRNGGGGGGDDERDGGDRGSAFMGVSGSTHTHSQTSSPPSIMSSDDVSASSSVGNNPVMVLPTSPKNVTFAGGRPPPSLARIRLEAVRSPVVRHGRAPRGRGGVEDGGPVFTSPDASKHVQELCSPRSAFTPRSASSVSSLASSPARRR